MINVEGLPCKPGDTVWYIEMYGGRPLCGARKGTVQMVGYTSRSVRIKVAESHSHNKDYMFGKTAFLSEDEAAAGLKILNETIK